MTPLEFATSTDPHFQNVGAVHYFHGITRTAADSVGLDMFRFYFLGRGGVLGPVDSSTVQSAFGYFNPSLLHKMWTTGLERCDLGSAVTAQMGVAYDLGAAGLGDVEGLPAATASLAAITESVDLGGLTLFAGFRQLDIPDDPLAAWMHHVILMRELRGSVHLAAIAAHGLPGRVAHQIKRPNDGELMGWKEQIPVTDEQRDAHKAAEAITNSTMATFCSTISDEERAHVAACISASAERITI